MPLSSSAATPRRMTPMATRHCGRLRRGRRRRHHGIIGWRRIAATALQVD